MKMEKILSKKALQIAGLSTFFILIAVYAFWGSHYLISGVKIKNVNIDDLPAQTGMKIANSVTKITGNAMKAVSLSLNGREISIDDKGDFNETIALLSGYNVINITAKDKFGYNDEENYKIIY